MDLQFQEKTYPFLQMVLQEVQNGEQTQEIKLSDSMPDVGRVLGAWGQVVIRGKEWRTDTITMSAGMMVWVLYAPEDGSTCRTIDAWIPMQMSWDLPDQTPEGQIRLEVLTRFVDARSVSARKIMVRVGIAALAEAYVPMEAQIASPEEKPEHLQLLQKRYPLRLPKEAGEKSFALDEALSLTGSAPQAERIIYYRLTPTVAEQRVLANKIVFRGTGILHVLYESEEGQLHGWDFELPFSQFAELQGSFSQEAEPQMLLFPTSVELELNAEGQMHFKCGIVSQYLISDVDMMDLVEDAYSTTQEVQLQRKQLQLPAMLDSRAENLLAEQTIAVDANLSADIQFLPDFPRLRRQEDRGELIVPGSFQVLYYGENGSLQAASARWETTLDWNGAPDVQLRATPVSVGEPRIDLGADMTVKCPMILRLETISGQGIPMISGLTMGEEKKPDPDRPSLILCRAGNAGLWELAKVNGSHVEAICQANEMEGEPEAQRMLLIPVI